MANSDIQLIVGANQKLSYSQLKSDIEGLIGRFNDSQKYKIKIGVQLDNKTKIRSDLLKEIQGINSKLTGSSSTTAKIKIGIDKSYIEKQYRQVISSLAKGDFAKLEGLSLIDTKSMNKMKLDVEQAKKIIAEYKAGVLSAESMKGSFGGVDTGKMKQDTATLEDLTKRITKAQKELTTSSGSMGKLSASPELTQLISQHEQLGAELQRIKTLEGEEKAAALSSLEAEIAAHKDKILTVKEEQNLTALKSKEEKAASAEVTQALKNENSVYNQQLTLVKQIQDYQRANSRIKGTSYGDQLDSMLAALNSGEKLSKEQVSSYVTQFKQLKTDINAAGLAGKSFNDIITSGVKKFSSWFGISQFVMRGVQGIKQMIATVTELDTAMTELRKVTDLTEQQYEKFGVTASNIAKDVGATIKDTINASADFARLGYNIDQSSQLAEAALVYKNVGDGIDDVGEASESIISTIKAFGIEAEDAMSIVDKFNKVGNEFAISSEGIGTALKKSAASLAASGSTIEESIGLAAGMNSVIQNPEIVGRVMPTLKVAISVKSQ